MFLEEPQSNGKKKPKSEKKKKDKGNTEREGKERKREERKGTEREKGERVTKRTSREKRKEEKKKRRERRRRGRKGIARNTKQGERRKKASSSLYNRLRLLSDFSKNLTEMLSANIEPRSKRLILRLCRRLLPFKSPTDSGKRRTGKVKRTEKRKERSKRGRKVTK